MFFVVVGVYPFFFFFGGLSLICSSSFDMHKLLLENSLSLGFSIFEMTPTLWTLASILMHICMGPCLHMYSGAASGLDSRAAWNWHAFCGPSRSTGVYCRSSLEWYCYNNTIVKLFCGYVWLFCGCVGIFLRLHGALWRIYGAFWARQLQQRHPLICTLDTTCVSHIFTRTRTYTRARTHTHTRTHIH